MSEYRFKAHPTKYAGIEFRSRLEATWAAFFDKLGWAWSYEPYDLQGWVPDFLIHGQHREVLIEVKPTLEMAIEALPKALSAAPTAIVALLTQPNFDRGNRLLNNTIGKIKQPAHAALLDFSLRLNERSGRYDRHVDGQKYLGFYYGQDTSLGASEVEGDEYTPFHDLRPLWADATNLTRWRVSA